MHAPFLPRRVTSCPALFPHRYCVGRCQHSPCHLLSDRPPSPIPMSSYQQCAILHLSIRRCFLPHASRDSCPKFGRQILAHQVDRLRISRKFLADLAFSATVARVDRQFQLGCLKVGLFFKVIQSSVSPWHAVQFKGRARFQALATAPRVVVRYERNWCKGSALAYADPMARPIGKKKSD